ncbi:MAG: hypothetical protein B7Y35_06090 [Sphingomonadales bacterium 28-64-96]|nr:MAG: hypothetical protein B7Y35_06090 [Sphingomonadales bacterium 28-64-96]
MPKAAPAAFMACTDFPLRAADGTPHLDADGKFITVGAGDIITIGPHLTAEQADDLVQRGSLMPAPAAEQPAEPPAA